MDAADSYAMASKDRAVLIIENDMAVAEVMKIVIGDEGFRTLVAASAAEGLRIAQSARVAVIFCDYGMPDMCGVDVIKVLRANEATKDISMVLMSGHEVLWRQGRADAFLAKPFTPDAVTTLLRALVPVTATSSVEAAG